MKFKPMEIKDTVARQVTMHEDSSKETVLFAEEFAGVENQNYEFVIGLPLAVREFEASQIKELASQIRLVFAKYYNGSDFAIAIHNKNLVDEVHFHISYNHQPLAEAPIKEAFEQFEIL